MSVDPTDPDTFDANDQEAVLDEEVPEADAAEQLADVLPDDDDDHVDIVDLDSANEADAAEQARIVALDEDDYR
ncbi:hypothetical protein ACFWDI_18320 [Streptomyces sp. NPDC060064]|uniref:hypothetical protein n=1 Tax=Streptomyces sp. NPDC060064 TaxID=3347049 RepID=UPI00368711B8